MDYITGIVFLIIRALLGKKGFNCTPFRRVHHTRSSGEMGHSEGGGFDATDIWFRGNGWRDFAIPC